LFLITDIIGAILESKAKIELKQRDKTIASVSELYVYTRELKR